jgi:hypothetical protein
MKPSTSSVKRGRDSEAVLNRTMFLVNKHQLLEKGVITQAELDHYLDFPLYKRPDEAAQLTGYKICLAEYPETKLDEIE